MIMQRQNSTSSLAYVLVLVFSLASTTIFSISAHCSEAAVKIGVLAYRSKEQVLAQWQPLASVLKQAMPEREFVVEALTYPEMNKAIASGHLDFVLTNPGHYIFLAKRSGLSAPLATLVVNLKGQRITTFGGVIFSRADSADITALSDIKGKAIASVDAYSLGGYQMQAYELSLAGVRIPRDVKLTALGMPHDNVIRAVLDGHADVGFVRTGVLESMAREGKLDMRQIKVLKRQNLPNYPVELSTRLYPEWPFTAMPNVNEELAQQVAGVLFQLQKRTEVTRAIGIHGFTVPADYSTVADLLRELRFPPFEAAPTFTLQDIWTRYRLQLIGGLLAIGLIMMLMSRLLLTKRKLEVEKRLVLQQKQHLQDSEERYRLLTDNASDVISTINIDGVFTYVSPSVEKLRGYTQAEALLQNAEEIFTPDALVIITEYSGQLFVKVQARLPIEPFRGELELRCKNGSTVWTEVTIAPIIDTDVGKIVELVSVIRDITERKRAEEEREGLQAQLLQGQKIQAIGILAGGIAHDFNNILGAIIGYAEIAKDDIPPESNAIKSLDKVLAASHRAATLVKQILTFSRQEKIEPSPLKPAHVVKEAIDLIRPALPSTIEVRRYIDSNTKSILVNPTQVHQIVMNLCTNAFHAMEQAGGILEITLKDCELSQEDLKNNYPEVLPGCFVVLSVSDTGPGIAAEISGIIFDPYFTTKEVGKGTGMGLAIVHGIVTSYGGFIICENNIGGGTVFRVFFPALEQEVVAEVESVEEVLSGTERILFVDDEEMLADLGKVMLEHLGYEVTSQTSSLEALATFQNQPNRFDAVITDQTMSDMTGMELARKILQIRPNIPIILCTGYSSVINEEQAKAEGIKGFADKPVTKKVIAVILRKVLDESRKEG